MINIISSKASAPNTLLQEVPRRENEDNLRWLSRQPRPGEDQTGIVLVGGTSPTAFRLRVAQSHVRHNGDGRVTDSPFRNVAAPQRAGQDREGR